MKHAFYMKRALELASLGCGYVSPNPIVGCVIVYKNRIIGEGYHQEYGGPHAEVNAINSVENKALLKDSEFYVSLEPCSHFGKTPPCADLIIQYKPIKVYVCNEDPFEKVAGRGIEKLRDAGIEVETGLLAEEGRLLNKFFFTSVIQKHPFVTLKWAQSKDAFVALKDGSPVSISNKHSQVLNHKWRAYYDAIMVGSGTVIKDNPSLTTRAWQGKDPMRVILDRNLTISPEAKVFKGTTRVWVFNEKISKEKGNIRWLKVSFDQKLIYTILDLLNKEKIRSLLVEGGPRLHDLFINSGYYNQLIRITGDLLLGEGLRAVRLPSGLKDQHTEFVKNDIIEYFSK